MGLNLDYIDGQTPIDEDEKEGLLIQTISTLGELDEFEQLNVEKAVDWTMKRKLTPDKILTEEFAKELHKRMSGNGLAHLETPTKILAWTNMKSVSSYGIS
jgi:hypothetical protein